MLLNELFKSDGSDFEYDIKRSSRTWRANTTLENGRTLTVEVTQSTRVLGDPSVGHTSYILFDVDGGFSKTNDGNNIEVFRKVVALLNIYVDEVKPTSVSMQADEDNRAKLYVRLLKRALPGWKIETIKFDGSEYNTVAGEKGDEFPVLQTKAGPRLLFGSVDIGYGNSGIANSAYDNLPDYGREILKDELKKLQHLKDKPPEKTNDGPNVDIIDDDETLFLAAIGASELEMNVRTSAHKIPYWKGNVITGSNVDAGDSADQIRTLLQMFVEKKDPQMITMIANKYALLSNTKLLKAVLDDNWSIVEVPHGGSFKLTCAVMDETMPVIFPGDGKAIIDLGATSFTYTKGKGMSDNFEAMEDKYKMLFDDEIATIKSIIED